MFAQPKNFIFLWHVKNFSMCPAVVGSSITSPVFEVDAFRNSRWSLVLYPKGDKANNKVSCYLKCNGLGSYNREICIDFIINVVPRVSSPSPFLFEPEKSIGVHVISLEEMSKDKTKFLPDDTLTIQCILSCINEGDKENEIVDALTWGDLSKENCSSINKCSVITTIGVDTKSFFWQIKSFEMLPMHKKLTLPVLSALNNYSPSLYVTLFKLENELSIDIEFKKPHANYLKKFVRGVISVIDILGDVKYHLVNEFLFINPDTRWNFPPFFKFTELKESKYFEQNGGTLYLRFDFSISTENEIHHSENQFFVPTHFPNGNQAVLDSNKLFLNDDHSIVNLRAGDETFLAHRSILSAESEVFEAMFENDMKEKESGIVEIPDVDPDTLGQMLAFIYACVSDLSFDDTVKLFAAADKYRVKPLMAFCCSRLASSLTASNVCEVLMLADRHSNKLLMESVQVFIRSDSGRILSSLEWMELMKSNPSLAATVMYKMIIG